MRRALAKAASQTHVSRRYPARSYSALAQAFSKSESPTTVSPWPSTGEPAHPIIVTSALPGPKGVQGLAKLNRVFDTRSSLLLVDYEKSVGN
jgi:hypothetical protein